MELKRLDSSAIYYEDVYGYGYGHGYGEYSGYGYSGKNSILSCEVRIDTNGMDIGTYDVSLSVEGSNVKLKKSNVVEIFVGSNKGATSVNVKPISGSEEGIELGSVKIDLDFDTSSKGDLRVEEYDSLDGVPEKRLALFGLGKYYIIDFVNDSEYSLTGGTRIEIPYTDAELEAAGLSASSLVLMFWNGKSWESPLKSGVDTVKKIVWAETNHFSIWRVFGKEIAESSKSKKSTGGVCSTEWIVGEWSECVNGVQTRDVTYPEGECKPIAEKPASTRACGDDILTPPINSSKNDKKATSGIGKTFLVVVVVLLILGILWFAYGKEAFLKSKKKKRK